MQSRWVDIDGPVHYAEYDGPSDGPTFVAVHGLGGGHTNWMSLAPGLTEYGRVLALDLIGFGRTPLGERTADVQSNRSLVERFVDEVVGGPAILVGNSMGGAISTLQAAARPDSVAGLVLVNPALPRAVGQSVDAAVAAIFAVYMIPGLGERFVDRRVRAFGPEGIVRQGLEMCCVDPRRVDPAAVRAAIELSSERAGQPYATKAFLQAARSLVRLLARRTWFQERVRAVSAPTLMIAGRKDRLVAHAQAEAVSQLRPDWDFVVFDDIGHVPQLECPGAVLEAIDRWLSGPAGRILRTARGAQREQA